jgi:NDP-sugar pyrophosphorylase family protein
MKRDRVTFTLRGDLVKQMDQLVDGVSLRSRSQVLEYLLTRVLSDFNVKTVLILAGGKSRELEAVAKDTPRCMIKIKGKPILQHIIERLVSFNITNYMVYVDHLGDQIQNYFGDGSTFGVKIEYLVGDRPRGTIHPLKLARKKINDTFILIYGDTISSLDVIDFLEHHRKNQNLATVALTSVSNPKEYGVLKVEGNKITEFIEKPTQKVESYMVSGGIFAFEPRIFNYLSKDMTSVEKNLLPSLVEKGILSGYPFQGIWLNINTPKDLKKARIML